MDQLVDHFFSDSNVQRLVASTATWEPLQICYPKEVNVSRFIAWLLDPTEGHGLGDLAIQSLLVRAWVQSDQAELDLPTLRFLSPANIQTEGFSASMVTTEVNLGGRHLDILVVDPSRKRYVAIENKFGANQSAGQLKDYRRALEKLFPRYLGVHIFLDSNEAEPKDPSWIPIGYDWLAEFLHEAEAREATAEHVRSALSQFRRVIEEEADEAVAETSYGRLVTEVASTHTDVVGCMADWSVESSKGARAHMLAHLAGNADTLQGKAMLRLFQLYWRRTSVWDDCIRQMQFAPFIHAMRAKFTDLIVNAKRVRISFSLREWHPLVEMDARYFPAGVTVWRTGETFRVITFIQMNDVRVDRREDVLNAASQAREENGIKRKVHEEQSFVVLRRRKDLSLERAVEEAVAQLHYLQEILPYSP